MAEFAITVVLRAKDQASAAIRSMMRSARNAERTLAGEGPVTSTGRVQAGGRRSRKNGILGADTPSIQETAAAVTQLGGAARAAVGGPIELAANFEAAMNRVNALSGGALGQAGKLGVISAKARELGKSTEFTATQAADAFAVLTQAGFGYEQQLASVGTVLDIATVAQIDMEQAANLTANAIGGFNLTAEDAGRVGNNLVRASNASQISIKDLGESFKYAAPGATKLGYSIEEVGTAIAILGRAGLRGSMGGTSLRAFLGRLSTLTSKDFATDKQIIAAKSLGIDRKGLKAAIATGDLNHLAKYMSDAIDKSGLEGTEKIAALQAIFQERGALGAQVLMASAAAADGTAGSWSQMSAAVNDANVSLDKSAAIMRSGTKNSATVLKSALEELGITVGEKLLPVIKPMIEDATEAAVAFAAFANKNEFLVKTLGKALIVTAGLATVFGPLLTTLASLRTMMLLSTIATNSNNAAMVASTATTKTATTAVLGFNAATAIGVLGAAAFGAALGTIIDQAFGVSDAISGANQAVSTMFGGSGFKTKTKQAKLGDMTPEERQKVEAAAARKQELASIHEEQVSGWMPVLRSTIEETEQGILAQQKIIDDTNAAVNKRVDAQTIARASGAPTIGGTGVGKTDVTGAITVVIDAKGDQQVRVGKIEEGDVPLKVDMGSDLGLGGM